MARKARIVTLVLAAVTVALFAWAFTPRAIEVESASITRGPFVQVVADDGITRVRERYIVTAPVSGTLLRPTLEAGDSVMRDEPVLTIVPSTPDLLDPRTRAELLARRDAAAARSARARTLVREAETARQQAELDFRRIEDLSTQGFISNTQREQSALTVDARRRALEAARFEADASEHDLEQSKAALSRLDEVQRRGGEVASTWQVRAPSTGQVLSIAQESGGPVVVGSVLLEIGDIRNLEAVIDVLSSEATRIRAGAPVTLTAGGDTMFLGHVRYVEPAARTKVSALGVEEQRVNVIVDLASDPKEPAAPVGDGFRVDARIEVGRTEGALQIPTAALSRRGDQWAVYAIRNGRARLTEVTLGALGESNALLERGLAEGDAVILYPSDDLSDGDRVQARAPR